MGARASRPRTPSPSSRPGSRSRPAALECRLRQFVDHGSDREPANGLVIASVTRIHVRDDALDGLVPRPEAQRLVGRMGGALWCKTRDRFTLERPASARPEDLLRHDAPRRTP